MSSCPPPRDLDEVAQELHAQGVKRTAKARQTYRGSFTPDAWKAHMRELAEKSARVRRERALARRRAAALEALRRTGNRSDTAC